MSSIDKPYSLWCLPYGDNPNYVYGGGGLSQNNRNSASRGSKCATRDVSIDFKSRKWSVFAFSSERKPKYRRDAPLPSVWFQASENHCGATTAQGGYQLAFKEGGGVLCSPGCSVKIRSRKGRKTAQIQEFPLPTPWANPWIRLRGYPPPLCGHFRKYFYWRIPPGSLWTFVNIDNF